MKAALVNLQTEIVENIIMVDSLEDPVSEGHKLVEVPLIYEELSAEQEAIIEILKQIDPNSVPEQSKIERPILIGETKWNEINGFYEENPA